MQLRASRTTVALPHGKKVICYDFVTKQSVECAVETLYWLSCFSDWSTPHTIAKRHPHLDQKSLVEQLEQLHQLGLLHNRQSTQAKTQDEFSQDWQMGPAAAILHFATLDGEFMSLEESKTKQLAKRASSQSPTLFWQDHSGPMFERSKPNSDISELLKLMAMRRSVRVPKRDSITKNQLIDCLFAGLGITGFVKTEVCELPLKMTPSGGARNPYEAFVYVQNVENLTPGFYHFSALDGKLKLLKKGKMRSAASLIANQDWANKMPAMIFLVAIMERTMWKYPDSNAYRVMLIEAGHIGQNIMLAATGSGLSACPTAALSHSKISQKFGLTKLTHAPIYALALCKPDRQEEGVVANPLAEPWINLNANATQ
jgi:SagB-type dehydrogenase family enzyme